jgi:protein-tyrosine phosphatase/nicotinamidase-related amidase
MKGILITQCLQNDFVELIDKYDPIPNQLHVGYEEAKRLLGEQIEEGPVNTLIEWAYDESPDHLEIIHIRDWHDDTDPEQLDHLNQFGNHCIKNTIGADFVFAKFMKPGRKHHIVNASGLNDFYKTNLEEILSPFANQNCRVGLAGVWTEAKITFLAYELKTRYPNFEIATCSLVTASSSRSAHFIALDGLQNILGIKVFTSITGMTKFLNGSLPRVEKRIVNSGFVKIYWEDNYSISAIDEKILKYLFRDAKEVECKCLDGGFSGNVVLKVRAKDKLGHVQVPSVIKIGQRGPISKERMAFEKIQEVLGNNAPSIVDFVEMEDRAAIKYRYASMLDGDVKTFQKYFSESDDLEKIESFLDRIFKKQLGRLYEAASREKLNLLEYYDFNPKYAPGIRSRVEELLGTQASSDTINILGFTVPNVCHFYEVDLLHLKEKNSLPRYMAYVHGDLNGANIIIDAQENVWIIDFFHTHKGHVLKDLVKLENDIVYIFTKINSLAEFQSAVKLVDHLIDVSDLASGLPFVEPQYWGNPSIAKTYSVIRLLRSEYAGLIELDRDPYQLWVAMMRYAMHTISFEECNEWQKKLALYAGCQLSVKIKKSLLDSDKLRIDFIESKEFQDYGKIGLTILPGRKDRARSISEDIKTILEKKCKNVVCLITEAEFEEYGVKELKEEYQKSGLDLFYLPIIDQGIPTMDRILPLLEWMEKRISRKENVLVHCVGGLGRSGTIAACYLIRYYKKSPEEAIEIVRKYRSRRAVESLLQEDFIRSFK